MRSEGSPTACSTITIVIIPADGIDVAAIDASAAVIPTCHYIENIIIIVKLRDVFVQLCKKRNYFPEGNR